jgi:signal transduction histidine kinase
MLKRKPETLVLFVALFSTLTVLFVFFADLMVSRQRDLDAGEHRLQHFGIMMAEHTARAFEAVDVLLREMATDLSHNRRDWEKWEPLHGWEYVAQHHSRSMPQLRDVMIFDREGNQRYISTYFPTPVNNFKDRPYFIALQEGAEAATYGPFIGRNTHRYSYGIARRINDGDKFGGVAFGAIDPGYLQDFCWSNRLSDDFEAVLINRKEQIVASCRPTDLSRDSKLLGALASEVLFNGGLRQLIPESGLTHGNGLLISTSPVPGFPDLRMLTAIPEATLLASWQNRLFELGTLGSLVTAVLLVGGLLVRRQVREMAALTAELAAGHEHLEERILQATQELAGQKDAAERASTAKSRFLAAASHDLRQPLHALSLFAADLQRQVRSGSTANLPRLAEKIATSTTVLGELLDSLLDISRLDVAGIKPEIRQFPLEQLFDRLATSLRRAAADRNLKLRFRPTKVWLESDPVMIERMIANLVSNALRYTPPGGRVLVAARRRDNGILIEIRDSGMGIAPEHQAAIFAEFYQIGNTAREQNKGLGLGLSIVDRLARALGIELQLRSNIGQGTTFSLLVKAGKVQQAPEPAVPDNAGKVFCVGESPALLDCLKLAGEWNYTVSFDNGSSGQALPRNSAIITNSALAAEIASALPADSRLIVLVEDNHPPVPAGAQALPLPIRPARLRALLRAYSH